MTVKELITQLLEYDMNTKVNLAYNKEHDDGYDGNCSGYLFDIDDVDYWNGSVEITFTDWREKQNDQYNKMKEMLGDR